MYSAFLLLCWICVSRGGGITYLDIMYLASLVLVELKDSSRCGWPCRIYAVCETRETTKSWSGGEPLLVNFFCGYAEISIHLKETTDVLFIVFVDNCDIVLAL